MCEDQGRSSNYSQYAILEFGRHDVASGNLNKLILCRYVEDLHVAIQVKLLDAKSVQQYCFYMHSKESILTLTFRTNCKPFVISDTVLGIFPIVWIIATKFVHINSL